MGEIIFNCVSWGRKNKQKTNKQHLNFDFFDFYPYFLPDLLSSEKQ